MSAAAAAPPGPAARPRRGVAVVFVALMLAVLLAALDATIVATALPTITEELGGLNQLSWVVTGYLLASTISTPLYGKLGDLYGRKRVFQASIVIFLAGSALCGLSQSMGELIALRTLQGFGGGGLIVLAQAIIGDVVARVREAEPTDPFAIATAHAAAWWRPVARAWPSCWTAGRPSARPSSPPCSPAWRAIRWPTTPTALRGEPRRPPPCRTRCRFGSDHRAEAAPTGAAYPACMEERPSQIVAFGGGGFSMDAGNPLLDDYVLRLTGVERPRVCFVPTASGDADHYIVRFYRTFAAFGCEPSHLSLFRRDRTAATGDPGEHLLKQDLIYVGGGSVISLLGVWRAHGIDLALSEAWRRGIVLCGLSAGSLCWFSEAVTAFHGAPQAVEGLGLLPHSNCVHYDGEPCRRQEYRRFIRDGMCAGYAADDGAALHFVGTDLHRVVASRPGKRGWRVALRGDRVVERKLATVDLGAPLALVA